MLSFHDVPHLPSNEILQSSQSTGEPLFRNLIYTVRCLKCISFLFPFGLYEMYTLLTSRAQRRLLLIRCGIGIIAVLSHRLINQYVFAYRKIRGLKLRQESYRAFLPPYVVKEKEKSTGEMKTRIYLSLLIDQNRMIN